VVVAQAQSLCDAATCKGTFYTKCGFRHSSTVPSHNVSKEDWDNRKHLRP
jgi:hypothetical protein